MKTANPPVRQAKQTSGAVNALRRHWPEYLLEAGALGLFMISACVFTVLFEHPACPVRQALEDHPVIRRALIGVAMGITAISIICSPWGKRSGAHMNPSVTLTFLALGKVEAWDATFYILFQFLGGAAGVLCADALIGPPLRHSIINYAITMPGRSGLMPAFGAELCISFLLMSAILAASNSRTFNRYTPVLAGTLVATFITFEAPLSGMSMNPARTVASALGANVWTAVWLYFLAPPAGMLLAAAVHRFLRGPHGTFCAKLHHCNNKRCIFRCKFGDLHAC